MKFDFDVPFKKGTVLHMLNNPVIYTDDNNYAQIFVSKMCDNDNYEIKLIEDIDVADDIVGNYDTYTVTPAMTIEYHLLKLFNKEMYKKIIALPLEIQEKIINYTYKNRAKYKYNPQETVVTMTENLYSLAEAFVFQDTKEKHDFWKKIDEKLKEGNDVSVLELVQTGDIIEQVTSGGEIYHSILYMIDDKISKIGENSYCSDLANTYGKDLNEYRSNDKIIGIYRPKKINNIIRHSLLKKESLEGDYNFTCIWKFEVKPIEISKKEIATKFNVPIEQLKIVD